MAIEKALDKEFSELQFYRGSILAMIIGIIAWLVTDYKETENFLIIIGVGVLIILLILEIGVNLAIRDKIKEIREA